MFYTRRNKKHCCNTNTFEKNLSFTLQKIHTVLLFYIHLSSNLQLFKVDFAQIVQCYIDLVTVDLTVDQTELNKSSLFVFVLDLNLSEIPPDLEDILVTSLDVPHGAESKVYGWQKVGNAAGISRRELTYYEYLGGRKESPTKLLLEKLGSQGRTILYLIDVLQRPRVELGSVAKTIIRHRVTRV